MLISTSRADSDGLSEQKRLEGLITRYKSMIPVIETTMVKIEVYSKSYQFRAEIQEVRIIDQIRTITSMAFYSSAMYSIYEFLLQAREKGVICLFVGI